MPKKTTPKSSRSAIIALTTLPSRKVAQQLAHDIIKNRLAACVQVGTALQSIYPWNGKIEKAREYPLWIKTHQKKIKPLQTFIEQNHPYQTPELLFIPITAGATSYLKWIDKVLR